MYKPLCFTYMELNFTNVALALSNIRHQKKIHQIQFGKALYNLVTINITDRIVHVFGGQNAVFNNCQIALSILKGKENVSALPS